MDVITSEKLVSHWQVEGNQLVKAPSLSDTYWMLDAMLGSSKLPHVSLNAADVKNLAKEFFEYRRTIQKPITQRQARKRVNRLLEQMNTLPNINAVLIPEPILTHRPTALPHSQQSFSSAMQMVELDRHVLKWSRQENTVSAWLTALAIRFMTNLGMGEKVMLGTLSQLTLRHVDKKNKILFIPSSPEALDGDGHYRMILPDDVWVPLRAIVTRLKERPEEAWLFAENESVSSLSVKERRQWLRQHCFSETRQLLNFHRENGKASSACLTTWPKIVKASQHVPVLKGTPSLWSTLLRDYPLPTCTPVPLRLGQSDAHYYAPGNRLGRLPDRQNRRGPAPSRDKALSDSNSAITRPAGVLMVSTEHLPRDWPRRVKNILQQFLSSTSLLSKKAVKAKKYDRDMQYVLEYYEQRLGQLMGFAGNYPLWLLHFLYHQLRTEGNTIGTAKTYLSRLTPITMLYHGAILDMSDWDDEVIIELEMAAREGSRWSERTLEAYRGAMRSFIRFCQQSGILEDVSLPRRANTLTPSVLRTRILSPDHMHSIWEELTKGEPDGASRPMMALIIELGFYGGLRASEVESLTVNDIQFGVSDEPEHASCWVDILGGKTAAARRRIALHVMAPPPVIRQLHGWVAVRRQDCSDDALEDIALFGPRHSSQAYERRYLITLVIEEMRSRLREDIDFHGLRHAAVSWTLLRLHAAQHPGFADTLQHRHHWMFQPQPLQEVLTFFCGAEGTDTIARGTILLHVAKWIGHRDPATLLENYAHTLGLIHSDILAPSRRSATSL